MPVLPSSLALTSIGPGAQILSADHRNNYAAIQAAVNAVIAAVGVTAKGDLLVATASGTIVNVSVGADGKVIVADAASTPGVKWTYPPGYEYAYNEYTAAVSITATTEATATTVATASAVAFDGATSVWVEFFSTDVQPAVVAGAEIIFALYDGASSIGLFGRVSASSAGSAAADPVVLRRRFTPAAATKTYSIRAYRTGGDGTVQAGNGSGAGARLPGYIRISKA